MADIALGRGLALPQARVRAVEWVLAHREVVAVVSIMALAALLRFWALGDKALHHDESLHAQFTWYLYHGDGYKHDPLMHGPFLFEAGSVIYFLFGDTDFTARILQATFGTALVGLPYFLRKQIGMPAVIIAAVLLTISPTMLYVSRFDRHDIYICFWTLSLVVLIWRYLDEQKPAYLYGLALVLALSFTTMELTFITSAILLLFLNGMLAIELGKRREKESVSDLAVLRRSVMLLPFAWLLVAAWPLLGKKPFGRDRIPPVGDVMIVLGTLTAPQFAAAVQQLPFIGDEGYNATGEQGLRVATVAILLLLSAYAGLIWRPRMWLICAAVFYIPYVLLYTTFLTNTDGFLSGIWGSLDYWLDQHHVQRGNQPRYYYGLMTPLYEFLPLVLALGGAAWLALKGDAFKRWMLFWLAGILIGLSIAGEKMPWLEVHIALPLAITGAIALAMAIDAVGLKGVLWWRAATAAAVTAAAVLLIVDGDGVVRLLGAIVMAGLVGWAAACLLNAGAQSFGRAVLAIGVAGLMTLTVRASLTASFDNPDVPVEMLVYTQTSPEIPQLRNRIDALARNTGLGDNLPIVVDATDGYAWPWAWYLRHYHDVTYDTPNAPGFRGKEGAVLLIHQANAINVDSNGYSETPYMHRWWFEEDYRGLTAGKMASILSSPARLKDLAHFFLYRRPTEGNTGSVDAVAFFPDSLAAFDKTGINVKPPSEPVAAPDGRIVIGHAGSGRGELNLPTDVFVDGEGNIWVADSRNNRIQKFDSTGKFVATLGRTGGVSFNEPWSVAVDSQGFVYVADTWNHKIQKFSPQLAPIATWGQPAVNPNPGPLELYGPRDIAVMPDNTLWVTDAGNKRLVHFSADGQPLGVFGQEGAAPGQFKEPVGLATDAAGDLYVADTWNGRVQVFEPGYLVSGPSVGTRPPGISIFDAGWTSQEVLAKPYIALLSDGRIVASEPAAGLLMLFDAQGNKLGTWTPEAESQPIGVAARPDGGFVFSDARHNTVQVVPGPLVSRLFK